MSGEELGSDEELGKVVREYAGILAGIACLEAQRDRVVATMEYVLPYLKKNPPCRPDLVHRPHTLPDLENISMDEIYEMLKEHDRLVHRKDVTENCIQRMGFPALIK